jgi:hypothetical protein
VLTNRKGSRVIFAFRHLLSFIRSFKSAASSRIRYDPRRERRELALKPFAYAVLQAFGDARGRGIRKDFFFAFVQAIEDTRSRGLGRGFRYFEAPIHSASKKTRICALLPASSREII